MGEIVSKVRLAALLGKDQKTLLKWQKEGMPVEKTGSRGQANDYDTEKVVDWLVKRASETDTEMERARIRLLNAQADKTELEVEELHGSLIPIEKMQTMWGGVLANFRARILSIPNRLMPQISTMREPKLIERLLKDTLYEALNELAEHEPEIDSKGKSRRKGSATNRRPSTAS